MVHKSEKASTLVVDVSPTSVRRKGVLTVVGGAHAGRLLDLPPTETISFGRELTCTYPFEDASLSRTHAMVMCVAGEYLIRDSGSTNGTFVNDLRIDKAVKLSDGDRIQLGLGTILRFALVAPQEETALRNVYDASVRDGLTGAYNRKHFEERLAAEFNYATQAQSPMSLILVDVDHFKRVNDQRGHLAGDKVLAEIAATLTQAVRNEDVVSRYGGEELVVLSRAIGDDGAHNLAERLRKTVEGLRIKVEEEPPVRVTISVGVAVYPTIEVGNTTQLTAAADRALYQAKDGGRNRVAIAAPTAEPTRP